MPSTISRISLLFWIGAALIAVAAYAYFPWWTVDDAFISYRYGRNLFQYGELTWNVGEPRVEGYTGILLPMLSGLLWRVGLPVVDGIKVLGIAALLATMALTELTLVRLKIDPLRRGVALLLLAASPLLYLHSLSGLETVFFMASVTWAFSNLADMQGIWQGQHRALSLSLSLLLAGLCRPEGLALAGIVSVHVLLLKGWFNAKEYKPFSLFLTLIVLLPLAGYWAWRMWYYDAAFPNSYYAKRFHGWVNAESVMALAKFGGYYLALPMVAAWVAGGWPRWERIKAERLLWGSAMAFALVCMATYLHSHLWMNYGSRFFVPLLPIGLVASAYLSVPGKLAPLPLGRRLVVGLLLIGQLGVMVFRYVQEGAFLHYYHAIVQDELVPAGRYLHDRLPAGSRVISYMDAGALGYYSELPIVDFGRLSDRYLAQNELTTQQEVDYFFQCEAQAVVMTSDSADGISYIDACMAIVGDARFHAQFVPDTTFGNSVGYPYWQHVFLRAQSPSLGHRGP